MVEVVDTAAFPKRVVKGSVLLCWLDGPLGGVYLASMVAGGVANHGDLLKKLVREFGFEC